MTTPITLEQVDNAINEILNEALCYRDRYGDARENASMISDYITQQRDEVERMAERLRDMQAVTESTEWKTIKHHLWFDSAPDSRIRQCVDYVEAALKAQGV